MDPWFLYQLKEVNDELAALEKNSLEAITARRCARPSAKGISDRRLSRALESAAARGRDQGLREAQGAGRRSGVYKRVDTCAAEFESFTPYMLLDL